MKNRIKFILVIMGILFITILAGSKLYQNQNKYIEYANEKLNWNFYNLCESIINANAVLENTIENKYILGRDLEYLKNLYFGYLRSLGETNNLSIKFHEFDFFSVNKSYDFNREYSEFYYRIDNLFENDGYDLDSTEKIQLNKIELNAFKQSYQYTSKAVEIIRNHIDYYNMFDIVIIEDIETKTSQFKKEFKDEYLEPWPDNKATGTVEISRNGERIDNEIPMEVARYDYPQKPTISIRNKDWINIHKDIHLLNIGTLDYGK